VAAAPPPPPGPGGPRRRVQRLRLERIEPPREDEELGA